MTGLRIGIDVGGTFTHGVVLRPPGDVLHTARTPTTHTSARGVAEGVKTVLKELVAQIDPADVEMVAHSTTQATNALLEGDVSGVHLVAIAPPGESALVRRSLGARLLDIGNGHSIRLWPKLLLDWDQATPEHFPAEPDNGIDEAIEASGNLSNAAEPRDWRKPGWDGHNVPPGFRVSRRLPVAVVQPLAGQHEQREQHVAAHYRACGHSVVCASEITQVLGLQARARTACVNASMLPAMVATAEFTAQAVAEVLPGVPVQVVRSDGGAMSLDEMRRMPVLSLLSGPAAGASAALHRTGLSEVVFIEVGGTSTDITLIREGKVRHRYATVGGQRLMVPALDLRTVAVGGGSMLSLSGGFSSRSAHKAGLPYAFQAVQQDQKLQEVCSWKDGVEVEEQVIPGHQYPQHVARLDTGGFAAITATDYWLLLGDGDDQSKAEQTRILRAAQLELTLSEPQWEELNKVIRQDFFLDYEEYDEDRWTSFAEGSLYSCAEKTIESIKDLMKATADPLSSFTLVGGGGGAPVVLTRIGKSLGLPSVLIQDHTVISAIGAALAVTCVSLGKSVAEPTGGDIAELVAQVEAKLQAQGAERVSTEYEYDPQRQVLTVTGRGNRPYDQAAELLDESGLQQKARELLGAAARQAWSDGVTSLWLADESSPGSTAPRLPENKGDGFLRRLFGGGSRSTQALALHASGRSLWQGRLKEWRSAEPGQREAELQRIIEQKTQYTDGGPALPGLALLCDGRLIPLDSLGSRELMEEILRFENLPKASGGCFLLRR